MATAAERDRPVEILLVEDNPGDVDLVWEALDSGTLCKNLRVVHDGEAAMASLRHEGPHGNTALPDLIILDLNLPLKDGRQVLKEIKTDDRFKQIPVIVLTSSEDPNDIGLSYRLQANCYIYKPLGFTAYVKSLQMIQDFWLTAVSFPDDVA